MRKNIRRLGCLFASILSFVFLCASVWVVGILILGIPQANVRLGPPSPALNPVLRTMLSGYLLLNETALDSPAGDPLAIIEIEVHEGETASDVVDRLLAAGVIENDLLLRSYLRYRGLDVGVEAGRYSVHGGMTIRQLAEILQTASPFLNIFTVTEGWRLEEIAQNFIVSGLGIDPEEFLAFTHHHVNGYSFSSALPDPPTLEGFMFPDTYYFTPESTVDEVVTTMLDNFEIKVTPELRAGFERQGLSLYAAVTLASIVEREAVVPEEQPLIASVFINRLRMGMKLEADPTVQYVLGLQGEGWWKAPLSLADLEIDTPFNTYRYPGLPPTPIANPGLAAIRAVAFPAESTYLYFRAMCDGSGRHAFAETFEQHLLNACP